MCLSGLSGQIIPFSGPFYRLLLHFWRGPEMANRHSGRRRRYNEQDQQVVLRTSFELHYCQVQMNLKGWGLELEFRSKALKSKPTLPLTIPSMNCTNSFWVHLTTWELRILWRLKSSEPHLTWTWAWQFKKNYICRYLRKTRCNSIT